MTDEQMVQLIERKGSGSCRTCGNAIEWARTITGAMMPLENELRVRALLSPELKKDVEVLVGTDPKSGKLVVVRPQERERFEARGGTLRSELHRVWEVPASLTHLANCRTANEHRRPRR